MDYKDIKDLYEKQTETISKLFENTEFTNLVFQNETLRTNFLDQISVLKFLEKKLLDPKLIEKEINSSKKHKKSVDLVDPKDLDKSDIYLKKFTNVAGGSNSLNEFKDIKKTEEIKDIINYLNVFLKNTFKKDLNYFLENKPIENESVKAEKIDQSQIPNSQQSQNARQSTSSAFGGGRSGNSFFRGGGTGAFGGGMFGGPSANTSYEAWKEQQILMTANQELRNQINSGQFYLYRSKPRIFVIFKIILGSLLVFTSLIWILVFIAEIIASSNTVASTGAVSYTGYFWVFSSDGYADGGISVSSTSVFSYIINIFMIIYFLFLGYRYIVGGKSYGKNENDLYAFDKRTAVLLIILMVIIAFTFIYELADTMPYLNRVTATSGNFTDTYGNTVGVSNTTTGVIALNVYLWSIIAGLISYVIVTAMFCVTWVYAPKPDNERIQLKLEEIVKQVRATSDFGERR